MAFLLQGNARSLRFDNVEPKSLATPSSPGALGKPRVRKPSAPPRAPAPQPQPTTRMGDAPPQPAPRGTAFPHRIPTPIPGLQAARGGYAPPARAPMESFSDEQPTMALDREVLPGRVPARPMPAAGRPIPNFRSQAPTQMPSVVVAPDTSSQNIKSRPGVAWIAWIAASILLGVASFHYAPTMLAKQSANAPAPVNAKHAR